MARSGIVWSNPPSQAWTKLVDEYILSIRARVRQLVQFYAAEIEAWMKQNAPWFPNHGHDLGRIVPLPPGYTTTGNARQTLNTEVEDMGQDMVTIILAHGVDYGIFLELANAGRYAIIGPSIDTFGPRIWQDVVAILR